MLRTSASDLMISIHAPQTGSDDKAFLGHLVAWISIHAPQTGSDHVIHGCTEPPAISIHAPQTGSDVHCDISSFVIKYFNPRSPNGERRIPGLLFHCKYFNPRSPNGERLYSRVFDVYAVGISIHAPQTGSDTQTLQSLSCGYYFNPRSPNGERQPAGLGCYILRGISIHAPQTGSDKKLQSEGGRRMISIHAPQTGSDSFWRQRIRQSLNFNPRSPNGERPMPLGIASKHAKFQSTLPKRGATGRNRIDHA